MVTCAILTHVTIWLSQRTHMLKPVMARVSEPHMPKWHILYIYYLAVSILVTTHAGQSGAVSGKGGIARLGRPVE